jgi:hypothetical protein
VPAGVRFPESVASRAGPLISPRRLPQIRLLSRWIPAGVGVVEASRVTPKRPPVEPVAVPLPVMALLTRKISWLRVTLTPLQALPWMVLSIR